MPASQKHHGPYTVKKIDGKYEIVERVKADVYFDPAVYEFLRPRKRYTKEQSARNQAYRMNLQYERDNTQK